MSATLTDRYVHAVLRALAPQQRDGIERELRATIADDIDARVESGAATTDAERAALRDLGHPARLAAGYANRSLTLIGPALYVDYIRLLKLLLAIVLPVAALGIGVANVIDGAGVGEIIGAVVGTTLSIGVHLCFWVTLVFAVLERTGVKAPLTEFDPDTLPDLPGPGRVGWTEMFFSVSFLALFAVAIVLQQFLSVFEDAAGRPIPVLEPALWSFWVPWFLGVILLEMVFAVVLSRTGRWTWPLAIANIVLGAAFTIPGVWLLIEGRLFDDAYFAEFGGEAWIQPGAPTVVISALVVIGFAVWDAVDGIVKTTRADRDAGR